MKDAVWFDIDMDENASSGYSRSDSSRIRLLQNGDFDIFPVVSAEERDALLARNTIRYPLYWSAQILPVN